MNHFDTNIVTAEETSMPTPRMDLDTAALVTDVTLRTFDRRARAIAGPIAYLGKGADLYDAFKNAHEDSSTNEEKELFNENKQPIAQAIKDTERAIIVGVGPLEYFTDQELLILQQPEMANLKEILLVDVSRDFLAASLHAANDVLHQKMLERKKMDPSVSEDDYRVQLVCDDYRVVASKLSQDRHEYFDTDRQTTVFVTGGLFGNIENPEADSFPLHAIQEEESHFAKIGGVGSKILASYFYKTDSVQATGYYQTPELTRFFLNIPKTIYDHCVGLEDFSPTPDNFAYVARWNDDAGYIEHRLRIVKSQQPTITLNGQTRVLDLRKDDEFVMMVSGRFDPVRMSQIPSHNTGLSVSRTFMGKEMALQLFYTQGVPNNISFTPVNGTQYNGIERRQENAYSNGYTNGNGHGHANGHSTITPKQAVSSVGNALKDALASGRAVFKVGPQPVPV